MLGDNRDLDQSTAYYANGALRLVVPVAEWAKPRNIDIDIEVGVGSGEQARIQAGPFVLVDRLLFTSGFGNESVAGFSVPD